MSPVELTIAWLLGEGCGFTYHIVAEQEKHSYPQLVCRATRVTPGGDHACQLRLWSAKTYKS